MANVVIAFLVGCMQKFDKWTYLYVERIIPDLTLFSWQITSRNNLANKFTLP